MNQQTTPEGIGHDTILSAIAEGSMDAITRIDADGMILSWSPGAERMLGYTADEVIGKPFEIILPEEKIDEERDIVRKQVDGNVGLVHQETVRVKKNGERILVQMTRLPLTNDKGETVALLAVLKDISEEKKLKKKLEKLERDTAMAKVAAKVAHEIRTPLGVLFLKSDLLDERLKMVFDDWGKCDADQHKPVMNKYIIDIQKQVARLEEIANNYLHLSKSRAMEREYIDLKVQLLDLFNELQEQYREDEIVWAIEIPDGLPKIFFDPQQLQRVVNNLVRNSIEAVRPLDHNEKRIGCRIQQNGSAIQLTLWDNGPGIPNDIKQTIFDPFTTTKSIGTGLGLYLVQEILQNHGGEISLDSDEGKGTSVHISIPVEDEGV